jgi:hypothetical protein
MIISITAMTFISNIANVGKSKFIFASIIAILVTLSNCASLIAKKNTYQSDGPAATVNGAKIRLQVNPQGAENGAISFSAMILSTSIATMEGPFHWRIEATGQPNIHRHITLHRIHTSTETSKRNEWYPSAKLPIRAEFHSPSDPSQPCRATCQIPGLLQVKSQEDGKLRIRADVSVTTIHGSERKMLSFLLDPTQKRADEFIFLPVEIVRSFGKSWDEMDESSWD